MSRLNRLNLLNKDSAGAISLVDFWIGQGVFTELWFLTSRNMDSNLVGVVGGDILTVSGYSGSESFQCPDTQAYKDADTDLIWFDAGGVRRTVLTDELRGYDFAKTIVWYKGQDPFTLIAIGILDPTVTLTDPILTRLYNEFKLNPWWDGSWKDAGEIKENRAFEQSIWTP
jgi:hypothetical protein